MIIAVAIVSTALFAVPAALLLGLVIFNALLARRAERLVPPIGRFITVDGVRLHYVDEGAGPVVFMLHGLASQLQTFTYALIPLLRDRYRLIALDRPGSGYSAAAGSATLGAQAALFSAFLAARGVERALVVGHSLGGALALALALDHPERVAGLALLAPATQPQGEPPAALRGLAIRSDLVRWLTGWTIAAPLSMRHRDQILAALFAPDAVPPDFAVRAGAILTARPATYRNAARDLVEAGGEFAAYAKRYGSLTMPVGVLFGRGDRILDYALHGEALARQIAHLHLDTVENGGHMTPISSPQRSAAFIDDMARQTGLSPRDEGLGVGVAQPSAATGMQ